ncbi:transposase [[Leptolyngbya] sp. PCC 7376]
MLYLSPYSPDFNKIEQCWSWLKVVFGSNSDIVYPSKMPWR